MAVNCDDDGLGGDGDDGCAQGGKPGQGHEQGRRISLSGECQPTGSPSPCCHVFAMLPTNGISTSRGR